MALIAAGMVAASGAVGGSAQAGVLTVLPPGQPADKAARTAADLDRLAAERALAVPPTDRVDDLGLVYARSSRTTQASVPDQVRGMLEDAGVKGVHIPREFIYYDEAIRGRQSRRPGLDRLRDLLRRRAAGTVFFFNTSRLLMALDACV